MFKMCLNKMKINGALIEKEFFEENVKEVKEYIWYQTGSNAILDHQHCIICLIAISGKKSQVAWRSNNLWLCDFCHKNFLQNTHQ